MLQTRRLTLSLALGLAVLPTLAAAQETLDLSSTLEEIRQRHDIPALVVLGLKDGRVQAQGVAGLRSAGHPEAATVDDLWHIGSCTKSMTSTMIATLVEEGDMSWDMKILDAIPDLESDMHEGFAEATLLQLLQHRAGIAERTNPKLGAMLMGEMAKLEGDSTDTRWQAIAEVLSHKPSAKVGGKSEYSNYGYMTAAAMAESVTGMTWRELMDVYLFEPLKMTSVGYRLPGSIHKVDQPRGHNKQDGKWAPIEPLPEADLPDCLAPAGLVHLSLADWARFVQAHMDGANGKDGLVSASTFGQLQTPSEGQTYACGWGLAEMDWSPGPVLMHNGSNGAWYSLVWASPSRNAAAMAVCNVPPGDPDVLTPVLSMVLERLEVIVPKDAEDGQ